jgi:hypothetical protein
MLLQDGHEPDHDPFEHPRRQAPELAEKHEDRAPFFSATSL